MARNVKVIRKHVIRQEGCMDGSELGGEVIDPRGRIPLDPDDAQHFRILERDQLLSGGSAHLPEAGKEGFRRLSYRGLRGTNVQAGFIFLPVGQSSPVHSAGHEHIITCLTGRLRFRIQGSTVYLGEWSQIFLPAGVLYDYSNVGNVDVWFHNVIARHTEWPAPESVYKP
jgi:quercetin dioxygenase-like cupin family protein